MKDYALQIESATSPRIRCAIYTRKSTNENLDNDFNTLDAQREAAEAYIESQVAQGWESLSSHYDDGGFTGANTERPALQSLLTDIKAGRVDCVVVQKVDRLSRSLLDFAKMIEMFDQHNVAFVSVTQQFNSATSMGRFTLNMLSTFAEFERSVITERIREKITASRRKGRRVGGQPPLGYDIDRTTKQLIVNESEANLVRKVFKLFNKLRSTLAVARELNETGRSKKVWITHKGIRRGGGTWNATNVSRLLNNVLYIGKVSHRGEIYPGEQKAIVEQDLWDEAQAILKANTRWGTTGRKRTPALLKGLVHCTHHGCTMGITYTNKKGRRYRYYQCVQAGKQGLDVCPLKSVAAGELEAVVVKQLREIMCGAVGEVPGVLTSLDAIWDQLFPDRQEQIVRRLVERVDVSVDRVDVRVAIKSLNMLAAELTLLERTDE